MASLKPSAAKSIRADRRHSTDGGAVKNAYMGVPNSWMVYFMENPAINGWFRSTSSLRNRQKIRNQRLLPEKNADQWINVRKKKARSEPIEIPKREDFPKPARPGTGHPAQVSFGGHARGACYLSSPSNELGCKPGENWDVKRWLLGALEPWNGLWLSRNSWECHHPNRLSLHHFSEGWNHVKLWNMTNYPLVNVYITMERSTMLLMGKLTISMAIVNSYVTNYQRVYPIKIPLNHHKIPLNHYKSH